MQTLDIVVLVIYVIGVTAFGALFYRQSSTTDGFTAANRNLPGWAVGLSIFGTYLSSISFLALPGKSYVDNWNVFVFSLTLPFAAWVAVKWFAPLYRGTRDVSAYAYLERRFGYWARLYAMTFYLLTQIARMGTILFLISLALQSLTGWDIATIIVVSGVLITFYTVIGGIEAVIWTDVVQAIILTIGAVVCAIVLVLGVPDGMSGILAASAEGHKFSWGTFAPDFTVQGVWVVFLFGIIINLQNFGIDQSYVQRYQTARSLEDAQRSIWVGALTYIPVSALFLFIGTALYAYYGLQPDLLPEALKVEGAGDKIFPHFIINQLPAGLTGLLIASLAAAAMSSVDTSMNSSATVLLTDVYLRYFRKDADDRTQMRFLRVVTIVLGFVGTGMALLMISMKSALDTWWHLASIFSGGILGVFLLGVISRRARSPQAVIAMIIGLLVIIWSAVSPRWNQPWSNPLHIGMTAFLGTMAIFLVGILLSRHLPRSGKASPPLGIHDLD